MAIKHIHLGSMRYVHSYDDATTVNAIESDGPIRVNAAAVLPEHLITKGEADAAYAPDGDLTSHLNDTSNPHNVTSAQLAGTTVLDGTCTFGGGGSGDVASLTFTAGLLTGITYVP